jgi:hypothetical protein
MAAKKQKMLCNWTLVHAGKTYEKGESIDLTDKEIEGLGGSGVVSPATAAEAASKTVSVSDDASGDDKA